MEMTELEKVIRGLRDIDMFIAGRLEHEKAKNFLRTIDETIALLKEQENDIHHMGLIIDEYEKELKKQEAKPVEVCGQMYTVKYGHCPKCGKGMDNDTYPHWCGFCGQAVKWE